MSNTRKEDRKTNRLWEVYSKVKKRMENLEETETIEEDALQTLSESLAICISQLGEYNPDLIKMFSLFGILKSGASLDLIGKIWDRGND